jgi:DNA repair exonuclease SbcCD ATPase subunit
MSKIIELKSQNIKRLQAVEIHPSGSTIIIGGKNAQGKSSVLDSIQYALGGEPSEKMPVRRGEEKATIVVDLGDLVVKRTFTAEGGSSLVVTNADGQRQSSPQAILDKLVGKLTFDPLDFSRRSPKEQAEILRSLVGLDFTAHDKQRQEYFDGRTAVNREAKALESRLAAMPAFPEAPDEPVSIAGVVDRLKTAQAGNDAYSKASVEYTRAESARDGTLQEIGNLEQKLAQLRDRLSRERESAELAKSKFSSLASVDLGPIQQEIVGVESINQQVNAKKARREVVGQYKGKVAQAEALTEKIEALDSEKRKKITEAAYPIPGLMFDTAGGVVLNGIPFEQCSSAEQLRVSVAIGLALNPKLKVLLIRDGSLLDDDSLREIQAIAEKADAQIWMERVGVDGQTSVVIEDGKIV